MEGWSAVRLTRSEEIASPRPAASSDATAQMVNNTRYAVSEGMSNPPSDTVIAASRLPPTALGEGAAERAGQRVQPVRRGQVGRWRVGVDEGRQAGVADPGADTDDARADDDLPQVVDRHDAHEEPGRQDHAGQREDAPPAVRLDQPCRHRREHEHQHTTGQQAQPGDEDGRAEPVPAALGRLHVVRGADEAGEEREPHEQRGDVGDGDRRRGERLDVDQRVAHALFEDDQQDQEYDGRGQQADGATGRPPPGAALRQRQHQADEAADQQQDPANVNRAAALGPWLAHEGPDEDQADDCTDGADPVQDVVVGPIGDQTCERQPERPADAEHGTHQRDGGPAASRWQDGREQADPQRDRRTGQAGQCPSGDHHLDVARERVDGRARRQGQQADHQHQPATEHVGQPADHGDGGRGHQESRGQEPLRLDGRGADVARDDGQHRQDQRLRERRHQGTETDGGDLQVRSPGRYGVRLLAVGGARCGHPRLPHSSRCTRRCNRLITCQR